MQIANHSSYTVEAVAYPAIGDLSRPGATDKVQVSKVGYAGLETTSIAPVFPNSKGYYGVDNPTLVVITENQKL